MYYTDLQEIIDLGYQYEILYADPCWTYRDKCHAGNRGACHKYDLMTDDALAQLPVPQIACPDSIMFMWVTMPKLREGLDLMAAWGFTYKTVAFTWVKRNRLAPTWFWGMGRWTRANAELVLLGTRGKPKRINAGVHSVIEAPIGPHSRKPPEVRDRIVSLMGDKPRIELFARGDIPDWDAWGNTPVY